LNAEAEQKRVKPFALRGETAALFTFSAPLYSPVKKTFVRNTLKNKSLLNHALSLFEGATKPLLQERRTTSDA